LAERAALPNGALTIFARGEKFDGPNKGWSTPIKL
jgi:hypothetical protein